MEAEELQPSAQAGEPAVRDPLAAVGPQAALDDVEVGGELLGAPVAVVSEAPPHERELAAVGLVAVLVADALGVLGQLPLVARDRLGELVGDLDQGGREPERRRQVARLLPVAGESEGAAARERLADRVRARRRVAVHVAADPAAEGERERRAGERLPVRLQQLLGRVQEAVLEEPEAVADLVEDARALRPHLVGLPEDRDLLGRAVGDLLALVERRQERAQPRLRLEDGATRRLGRVRSEDQLERDVLGGRRQRLVADPALLQPPERVGERLPWDPVTALDVAAAAHAVLLLGQVGELEEERERAQDLGLPLEAELADGPGELGAHRRVAGLAGPAGDAPDLLLLREQLLALLLDHDTAEQVSEEADVAAERRVECHGVRDYAP